ncbi:GTP-binding protein Parf [Phytophthora megakarya]|uniref:GTP-binding protein Parf n=1 Tax=Phytophthora megakarya TaxID=4795 RepID=A0A225W6K9_9STRA|nr:GTP-binding protein Parf [Phytophthora megakarya]
MGNEVSRPEDLSPPTSGVVPPRSPYTPTGGSSRRAQSFNSRSPSPSAAPQAPQRRTSSSSSLGSNPGSNPSSNPKKERTIQRMDKAIRRRVRGGITYNMKLLLRGAKGTGKTSLFHRLKGEPIPETHQSTPQLQSATINWSFRQNSEENVKCEVWDVVDKGFVPVSEDSAQTESAEHGGLQSGGSLSAEATSAAAAAAAAMQNGTHSMAIVDASTVDVYHEAHGVIFLLDVTKWDTLEYVKQQLDNVPVHIPTLVLGNFRDQGAQRKIFKEDIQELLYGSSDRPQHQQWRRPTELLYFESIRKAQEEAMRMLPTEPSPVGGEADSSSSKKHKYKHKKQHKHRKLEDGNGSKEKKTSRKSGSSSRSKKRRPHVEDDLM